MKFTQFFLRVVFALFALLAVVTARVVPATTPTTTVAALQPRQSNTFGVIAYALLYLDINYTSQAYPVSDFNTCVNLPSWANDKVSSFKVFTPNRCFFYLDPWCQNVNYNTPNNNNDLRSVGFNDNISSVRCT
ncbi:hypothetical protein HGRIS_014014 [Hohenbuehelia grisea]|uniref:Uncharacterized protein n=1 Tax=Hohenbuehelia grisea TaxID=104357 RepID=A0ABR3JU85_9AGAR